jgi:hypothetical protein
LQQQGLAVFKKLLCLCIQQHEQLQHSGP